MRNDRITNSTRVYARIHRADSSYSGIGDLVACYAGYHADRLRECLPVEDLAPGDYWIVGTVEGRGGTQMIPFTVTWRPHGRGGLHAIFSPHGLIHTTVF